MESEFGKRRADIMSFLNRLNRREKLVVLSFLGNDAAISARIPGLARAILDMHRACHKLELVKSAETEHRALDLGFLARRKGCTLERVTSPPDRWRIRHLDENLVRQQQSALTLAQALELLRALPDKGNAAKA